MRKRINTAKWLEQYQRWQINVQKDGERKTFYSSTRGRNGKREVHRKADNWLDNNLINQNINVEAFSKEYIANKTLSVGKSRIANIKGLFNSSINPILGKKKVSNLTEYDLQTVLNKMYKKGKSYKYINECKKLMCDFIKFARQNSITMLMPESLTVNKNAPKYTRDTLQPSDIYKLFKSSTTLYKGKEEDDEYIHAYRFIVSTGLRRGELIGLKWSDIIKDVQGNTVMYINRSINEYNEVTKGKTSNSQRVVILPDICIDILKEQKALQEKKHIKSPYVFTTKYGEHLRPGTFTDHFKKYAKYNKLSRHKLHELRHTFISINQNNLSMNILKDIVGHSPKMDTLNIYGHTITSDLEKASSEINSRFIEVLQEGQNSN